ncbi:MAG TPA: hypothetical protein PKJ99_05830 [Thermoanaerobaculales bacterium]|nr:hypothetical protein [Thermoanaerobaculales bacterium]HQL28853.1 hypothetical protein [Thermoanaerobaculales bacterium]HQP88992.1 hypothetical protein [Thermoanaerobaculia bacterium]
MAMVQTLRVASGSLLAAYSSIWRIVVDKSEIYLGSGKVAMGIFKVSLHASGTWVLAATKQSGATFEGGNRRAKQWNRPLEHVRGVTRGPSVLIPHTSLGARKVIPGESVKEVHWYRAPHAGETVEFSLYFVEAGIPTSWASDETVVDELRLPGGRQLFVLASARPSPVPFLVTVERLLRENIFGMKDPDAFTGGSLLWVTQSEDSMKIPLLVDLPVPLRATP